MGAGERAGEAERSLCPHVGEGVSQVATSPGQVPQGPLGRCQPVAWSWGECRVVMIRGGSSAQRIPLTFWQRCSLSSPPC